MSRDSIDDEEQIGNERLSEKTCELIHGTIRDLTGLHETVVSVDRTATVSDAVNVMIENRMGVVLVIEEGRLFGLFSERDVLTRVVASGRVPAETPITEVMTADPECLSFSDEIVFALNKMTVGGFRHIPLLDKDGRPTAVMSMRDVVEHIVSYYSDEVYNLPSEPEGGFTSQREGA